MVNMCKIIFPVRSYALLWFAVCRRSPLDLGWSALQRAQLRCSFNTADRCREVTRFCYDLNFVVPRSWLECIVKCQRMVIGDLVLLEKISSQKAGDQSANRIVAGRGFMLLWPFLDKIWLTFGLSLRCAWMEAAFSDERCPKKLHCGVSCAKALQWSYKVLSKKTAQSLSADVAGSAHTHILCI